MDTTEPERAQRDERRQDREEIFVLKDKRALTSVGHYLAASDERQFPDVHRKVVLCATEGKKPFETVAPSGHLRKASI